MLSWLVGLGGHDVSVLINIPLFMGLAVIPTKFEECMVGGWKV